MTEANLASYHAEAERLTVPNIIVPEPNSIYVGGPMRGYDLYNFPAFDAAQERLTAVGWRAYSPAEHDRNIGFDPHTGLEEQAYSLEGAFRWDVAVLSTVSAIYLLEGWEQSQGANLEYNVATMCGLRVHYEEFDRTPSP